MHQGTIIPDISFKAYLLGKRRHRMILWIAAAAIIIQFGAFKYFYPFASYIHDDSFVYLETAYWNLDINSYMVGYARFLRLMSVFSSSDLFLTAIQYLLIQGSGLFLLFTIFYYYGTHKIAQIILFGFMVLNPLFLYMANLISSDALFLALSLCWFALLLHLLHRPNKWIIICHSLVLFIAFTVRYNALIYPAIAALVFLLSKQSLTRKIIGWGIGVLLCGLFFLYTGNKHQALTGTWQYSPFGGWLMANNAMYAYRYVDSAVRKPVPLRFQKLDNMIRAYFDSTRDLKKYPKEAEIASTIYMWDQGMPLYIYRNQLFKKDTVATELKRWASMGPVYKAYGSYIIKAYPLHYARYVLWPHAVNYYAPPVEYLSMYNSKKYDVQLIAQLWFEYKNMKIWTRTRDLQINLLNFYPVLTGAMNVIFICGLLSFMLLNGYKTQDVFNKALLLATIIWLVNAGFTIFASPAALRFQAFPIILVTIFSVLLFEWMCEVSVRLEAEKKTVCISSLVLTLQHKLKH